MCKNPTRPWSTSPMPPPRTRRNRSRAGYALLADGIPRRRAAGNLVRRR
jgi:hypothetical protein